MGRYQRTGLILGTLFMVVFGFALRHAYQTPEVDRPVAADHSKDFRALTDEEKKDFGPDDVEQNYDVFLNTKTGKKCSNYEPSKSDGLAKRKHEPEYTASLFYAVYGPCPR